MRKVKYVGLLLALSVSHFSVAQDPSTTSSSADTTAVTQPSDVNLEQIRAESKAFIKAFNNADAAAIASKWTSRGEYIDGAGKSFNGREEIEGAYADFFNENDGATLQLTIESLKALSDAAAIEYGTSVVEVSQGSPIVGRYEAIHVKVDGKWQMASVRDAMVQTDTARQHLSDLDFLIGSWVAEEQGNKTESVCSWVSDRCFVKRDYTTTLVDGTKSGGMQLIGWNPQTGQIQSWTFSPDGGHAIGTWIPTEEGWAAQMQGTTGGGILTTAVNLLRRLDDNAYVWQSVDRTIGGVAFDDTGEVVIKRQP